MAETNTPRIEAEKLEKLVQEILCAKGVDLEESSIIAQSLVWSDLIDRQSHGVLRLSAYLKKFQHGLIKSPCVPTFIPKSEVIYLVDGHDGFGHYIGYVAMSKAIHIAKQYGVGIVGVSHSNHFGAGAYYVELAAKNCQLGLALSNSFPIVAPYGGVTTALGTNPFAFGAPRENGQSILVDFSTGAAAGATLRKAVEKNAKIPEGVLTDNEGNYITEPDRINQGVVLPFGGAKGFCLGLMVEILSGVITSAGISHEIASMWKNWERSANNGHFFLAIDIPKIMPPRDYYERIERLTQFIKSAKPKKGVEEILLPGEVRWRNYYQNLEQGIALDLKTVKSLTELAQELNLSITL